MMDGKWWSTVCDIESRRVVPPFWQVGLECSREWTNRKEGGVKLWSFYTRRLFFSALFQVENISDAKQSPPTPDAISSLSLKKKNFFIFIFSFWLRPKEKGGILSFFFFSQGNSSMESIGTVITAFDRPDCNCLLNVGVEEANNSLDKRGCQAKSILGKSTRNRHTL